MENTTNAGIQNQVTLKHSGLGIASFIIGIASTIILFICFGILACGDKIYPEMAIPNDVITVIIVVAVFFGFFTCFVGFGLAIAGLIIKGRKKLFPILGLTINSALFLVGLLILIIAILGEIGII